MSIHEISAAVRRKGYKCSQWGFEEGSNDIRQVISSVMLGSVCSESHNTSTCSMKTLCSEGVRFDVLLLVTDPTPHKREEAFSELP